MVTLLLLDKSSLFQNNSATKTRHNYSRWRRPGNLKTKIRDSEIRFSPLYTLLWKKIKIYVIEVIPTSLSDVMCKSVFCFSYYNLPPFSLLKKTPYPLVHHTLRLEKISSFRDTSLNGLILPVSYRAASNV